MGLEAAPEISFTPCPVSGRIWGVYGNPLESWGGSSPICSEVVYRIGRSWALKTCHVCCVRWAFRYTVTLLGGCHFSEKSVGGLGFFLV